jgi:kelch-like protein 10
MNDNKRKSSIDRIYVCGGFNGQECMTSAEYFDPTINQWTMIAPMRHRRSGVSVIAYHQYIYALYVNTTNVCCT